MVETMNGLKDHANSVKMQLDIARANNNIIRFHPTRRNINGLLRR